MSFLMPAFSVFHLLLQVVNLLLSFVLDLSSFDIQELLLVRCGVRDNGRLINELAKEFLLLRLPRRAMSRLGLGPITEGHVALPLQVFDLPFFLL